MNVKNTFSSTSWLSFLILFIIELGEQLQMADVSDWWTLLFVVIGAVGTIFRQHELSFKSGNFILGKWTLRKSK